ncbi:CAZyme family CE10 [Penicillium chermesinum]|nr:CAZyme family CE10 [Penicillium chermesinum]
MAQGMSPAGDPALHEFRVPQIIHPLHNSIPRELESRFDPVYSPLKNFEKNPARYTISYGRAAGPDIYRITEQKCPVQGGEITIRIFEPAPKEDGNGQIMKRAAYVNFHGGGWVFGGLSTDHDFCKTLVHGLEGHLVAFDVDYRLAPENKYPVPLDDCWTAFNWIRDHKATELNLDPSRFAVGGASAGGHLAAVTAHLCRDAGIPLRLQVLTVPVCDIHSSFTPEGVFDPKLTPYESYREMEYAPALPAARMAYFHRHFLGVPRPAPSNDDWKISPMRAPNFHGLAPALVSTAELDPLRDEGEAYAAKMEAAGVRVMMKRYPGVPHLIASLDGILEGGRQYNIAVIAALQEEMVEMEDL